jgi:hypothetical protein
LNQSLFAGRERALDRQDPPETLERNNVLPCKITDWQQMWQMAHPQRL